jgi:transposase-like protein
MNSINRFSSRHQRLDHAFLRDRLKNAKSYKRIAGYFRSSIFELVGEEIANIPTVQIIWVVLKRKGWRKISRWLLQSEAMSESMPSCPSCQSLSVVKNGSTRHGKQNYKCRDCGRQFVENPKWQRVSERIQDTYDLLEKLLLEKIPLAGIARVLKISERWLQSYVNHKYEDVPQQVEVEPKPKHRLTIQMDELWWSVSLSNCLLWMTKAKNSGCGLQLMPRLVKL